MINKLIYYDDYMCLSLCAYACIQWLLKTLLSFGIMCHLLSNKTEQQCHNTKSYSHKTFMLVSQHNLAASILTSTHSTPSNLC